MARPSIPDNNAVLRTIIRTNYEFVGNNAAMTKGASTPTTSSKTLPNEKHFIPDRKVTQTNFARVEEPPPFNIDDVRNAIPKECFERSLPLSVYYFLRDFVIIGCFFYIANHVWNADLPFATKAAFYALYMFAQGTMFWANFVIGHDCGHGSFSDSNSINYFFGHISHTFILVPFHSWRITHHHHHMNTGSVENDHTFVAPVETEYRKFTGIHRFIRFTTFWLLGWPLYLTNGMHPVYASHFDPTNNQLFPTAADKRNVRETLVWYVAFLALLTTVAIKTSVSYLGYMYFGPWAVFCAWISIVTHLHHTHPEVPWYQGSAWWYLRGALSSVDRSYGAIIDHVHHNIGTHVVHHIFHKIPHYNLVKATEAVKPLLGKYHRKDHTSIFVSLFNNWKYCRYVPDGASVAYLTQ